MAGRFPTSAGVAFAIVLSVLACTLRFSDLGTWSFANDETFTLEEDAVLFGRAAVETNSQTARLPRITPVSYGIMHVGYELFGRDEFGSRVVPALFGSLAVLVVFLVLDRTYGRTIAVAAGLMVAAWPEHVLRSQQNRFYIIAMFFGSACLLLGSLVVERRSFRLAVLTSASGLLAVLSHSLTVAALLLAVGGLGLVAVVRSDRPPTKVMLAYLAGVVAVVAVVLFYVLPLTRGWNAQQRGYSLAHAVFASVNMLGWPVSVLAGIGVLYMLARRTSQDLYWLTAILGWGGTTLVLPKLLPYHPGYAFPLAFCALISAAVTVGCLYETLVARSRAVAFAALVLCCLLNLPSLASHYVDGSRPDWRAAAQFVRQRWQPGDRVTSFAAGFIGYYAPECTPRIPLSMERPIATLDRLSSEPTPLWVVADSSRGGLETSLKSWLRKRCVYEREVVGARYDYNENRVDVYRCLGR